MTGRHLCIAIPAYSGTVRAETMSAILKEYGLLTQKGYQVTVDVQRDNAIIADCRNAIVARFLDTKGLTDLLFVDHDVYWEPGTLIRLLEAPVDCMGAIYPLRNTTELKFKPRFLDDKPPNIASYPKHCRLEVEGMPIGCARLSRRMLLRMVEAYRDTEFHCDYAPMGTAWGLFDQIKVGMDKYGEDYSFFMRWRRIGGKVWCDPDLVMGHVGTHASVGSLRQWLQGVQTQKEAA